MKVAIVGAGNIAGTHAKALRGLEQTIELAVGRDLAATQVFAKKWNVPKASDRFEDALAPEIDCVHLCTPPALHYEMAKAVIQAGKHIVCEKPLCLDAAQARELAALAREKNVLAAVNFNVRYHEACGRARAMIADKNFGDVHLIHGSYLQEFHVLPAMYMWRYIPEVGGNMRAVTEIGSHWIDLVRYWTGLEIEAVSADFGRFNPDRVLKDGSMYPPGEAKGESIRVDSEDAAVVMLRFSNGAIGSLLLSEVSHGRSNAVSLEVSSGKRSVWWCSEDPYRLNSAEKFSGVNGAVNAFGGGFPDTFTAFFSEVYAALAAGNFHNGGFPSFEDGAANAAVCQAIGQSAANQSKWTEV